MLSQDLGRLFRQILWSACRGSHDSTVSRAECGHSERQGSQGIPSLVLAMHSSDGGTIPVKKSVCKHRFPTKTQHIANKNDNVLQNYKIN